MDTEERRMRDRACTERWRSANRNRVSQTARAWLYRNPEKAQLYRERQRCRRYGLTVEEWQALFTAQQSQCAVCGSPSPDTKKGWHTDHCHETGAVRGILCQPCNLTLGHVKDNPARLRSLIAYLEAR